ncbi:RNA-binding protein [Candidatus Shapirobacteria bacterium]|nr:RNA-binding protein [Candidatus Shapirobacteria bacterium]
MPLSNTPAKRLFVGGLPFKYTEGQLLTLFAPFGRIISLQIAHNQWGKSRGLGFVEFDLLESAVAAQKELHNHRVDVDRTIIVDFAKPDPLTTPEGIANREEALRRRPVRRQAEFVPTGRPFDRGSKFTASRPAHNTDRDTYGKDGYFSDRASKPGLKKFGTKSFGPKSARKPGAQNSFGVFGKAPKFGSPDRQSVYDSRAHHSRVGAKFASKNRKQK